MQRRDFLASALLPFAAGTPFFTAEKKNSGTFVSPINVFIPPDFVPDVSDSAMDALKGAVLQFFGDLFPTSPLPLWKKPLAEIDMGLRLDASFEALARGITNSREIFPIDPVWVVSQIMAESFFYDGAISNTLAVGLCQIMPVAARENSLLVATDRPEHKFPPFARSEFSYALHKLEEVQRERQKFIRMEKPKQELTFDEALQAIAEAKSDLVADKARELILYKARLREFDDFIRLLRSEFRTYLEANYTENGGAHPVKNLSFFEEFDQRFAPARAVPIMVAILAKNLKRRNGNILAAGAAYNAGLSTTVFDEKLYSGFGRIPAIEETTRYLSRIVANYFEIVKRLNA